MTAYVKVHENWEDLPSTATPIDAAALEQMEDGIASAQDDADSAASTASAASSAVTNHTGDPSNAHAASAISVTAAGGITSDDVQAALEELDSAITASGGYAPGGTDVAIADGGTGASTAPNARTNLGLGTIATQDADDVAITGGSITGVDGLGGVDPGLGVTSVTRTDGKVTAITGGGYVYTAITRTDGKVSSFTLDGVDFDVTRTDGKVTAIQEA